MATKLKAAQSFGSFGARYEIGDTIESKDLAKWPEGTLATRLENGSVVYVNEDEDPKLGSVNTDDAVAVAVKSFSAWGHDYNPGDAIPMEHHETWAPGTLATRLQNGDVAFKPRSEVEMELERPKVTTDSNGALDGGAPKTAVGDNVKDAQVPRAKESALHPNAGAVGQESPDPDERGGAETGTLDELAANSPQTQGEDLQKSTEALQERARTETGDGKDGKDDGDEGDDESLPKVADLKEHLENLESTEEIRELQTRDKRKTAQPIYEARLEELEK
jgi:hypothetical protein